MGRSLSAWLPIALVAAACTSATPAPSPTPTAEALPRPAPPHHTYWAYERTLLAPRDDTTYENVLLDAKPFSDGGWIVVRDRRPYRYLLDPTVYGPLSKNPTGEILRLDANGGIVAKEHAAEPLGVTRVDVFEDLGVVVAQGPQVQNGNLHALRLDSLDGIGTQSTSCIVVEGRCWSYRTNPYFGSTALEERDPQTLAVIRTYPRLTMDWLESAPAIFPRSNLIVWRSPRSLSAAPVSVFRVEPLDASRPIAVPWLDKLRGACGMTQLADDRALVEYGPPECEGEAGWSSDLVEVSSGRVLRHIGADEVVYGNDIVARRLTLWPSGLLIDPRTGDPGPFLARTLAGIDFDRGVGVVNLTSGGADVLRRHGGSARPREIDVGTVASGRCGDVDFPRLVVGPTNVA